MSSEKMAILNMLEQGKITADNAAKLLAALGESDGSEGSGQNPRRERDFGSQERDMKSEPADVKKWAIDLGKKIEVVAKDLEPKIQKIAGSVAQKSIELADATVKTIQTRRTSPADETRPATGKPAGTPAAAAGSNSETFEIFVSMDSINELKLKSPKGDINVKGYNGDKMTVKVTAGRPLDGKKIELLKLGGVYELYYDLEAFDLVTIEAYIPYDRFGHLLVETSKGNVNLDNIAASKITVNTAGCHISAKNIVSDAFRIDNLDGPVLLSNSNGEKLTVDNANAGIDAANTDFRALKLETTGETVTVVSQGFYKYNDYNWIIRTSNARLRASLPVSLDTAYDIKAYTSLSDVLNGMPDISYTRNDRNCIEGRSANYGTATKKVRLELDTSNAPLHLN